MTTIQAIDTTIFTFSHPDIAKRTSIAGILFSLVLLLLGILAFVVTFRLEDRSSAASMGLMVLGAGLCLWGIFRLFWKSRETVYLPTGSVTKSRSLFFDLRYMERLTDMVNSGSFPVASAIRSEASGNVRMDVMVSEDRKFAAVQLFQFVPYNYQPVTSVHYFTDAAALAVAVFLAKAKWG